jgi:outer membrane protein TolC
VRRTTLLLLLLLPLAARGETVTFDEALRRAERGGELSPSSSIGRLENLPRWTMPLVRVEAASQRAENIELTNGGVARFDALTALLHVDYPLFDGARRARQLELARVSAELFRREEQDESERLFNATLDAFADLGLAERRMEIFAARATQAAGLRERAAALLAQGEITNVTAASWEEQALIAESRRLAIELELLEARSRLRDLIGGEASEPLTVSLPLDDADSFSPSAQTARVDAAVDRAEIDVRRRSILLADAQAQRRPQFLASAFGGVASVPESFDRETSDRSYGIYGFRFSVTLPPFDTAAAVRLVEAELELNAAERRRVAAEREAEARLSRLQRATTSAAQRIAIVEQQIALAIRRRESMARLVDAGVRTDSALFEATMEVAERESDLEAARVELWKLRQMADRISAEPVGGAGR